MLNNNDKQMIKLHKIINSREREKLTELLWIAGTDGDVYGGRMKT